ncbi:MAG: fimbrial protein [Rikenellaceae bacterium]
MKKIYIISLLACFALIGGCKKDSVIEEPASDQIVNFVITMNVYNNTAATRSTSTYSIQDGILGSAEYIIDCLRIYVFASDGSLDKMEFYDNLNTDQLIGREIEVPKDSSKEIYFVANEPDAISDMLESVSSAEDLLQMEFTIAEEMNKGFNAAATFSSEEFTILMSATYSVQNASSDINIYVGLSRAVARVDLYLHKTVDAASRVVELNGSTILSANGVTHNSDLFKTEVVDIENSQDIETASSEVTLLTETPQRVLSFYTSERKYSLENDIAIDIEGLVESGDIVDKKSIILGDDNSLTEINRNYVYRIYGSYNGEEIIADDLEIVDWEDVEIDAEIEGVMVAVDNEVAMDWLRNGNTYTSKSISFGSNKAISFYLPVVVSSEDEATPDYEFKLFEFDDMSAGKSYNLKDIALANNYIYATSWIDSATIHFTSPQSGYIEFVYTPVKVSYKIQGYPIRIKSDNVIKQMMAVYDNGYLPATFLSDDWAKRAPGGVVFAKRGEAKHPVSTPDIFYRDDDGYYRGEYQTTAEDGTTYCEQTFGDGWYMPSYADMLEIASMFDMLGVSYRFQNNGSEVNSGELTESRYWTSSASSVYPGMYWSADFMYREYMIENLMERRDGSQSYYVRCLMDLQ